MAWCILTRLSGSPSDAAILLELDHVVLSYLSARDCHREDITDAPDPLSGRGLRQVVVAIPTRLLGRVRDQLEQALGASRVCSSPASIGIVFREAGKARFTRACAAFWAKCRWDER